MQNTEARHINNKHASNREANVKLYSTATQLHNQRLCVRACHKTLNK